MPRAVWTGSIAFGLVNAPVRMYPAIDEHDLELHLVHTKDGSRIGYQKICKAEGEPVPDDEVAKAYEVDGELVLLEPEDFEAAESESYKTIEILAFVPQQDIDPIYFERSYYLGPQDGGEKVYALLLKAMAQAGLVGVVRYVFHDRERLGALRVRDDVLVLASMHFADEIRAAVDIAPSRTQRVPKAELEMALDLIRRFSGEFDLGGYEDRYRARLLEVVERKRRGDETKPASREAPEATPDLLTALRQSVERYSRAPHDGRGRDAETKLEELTVPKLNELARALDIEGRSTMSKRELVDAIADAKR